MNNDARNKIEQAAFLLSGERIESSYEKANELLVAAEREMNGELASLTQGVDELEYELKIVGDSIDAVKTMLDDIKAIKTKGIKI